MAIRITLVLLAATGCTAFMATPLRQSTVSQQRSSPAMPTMLWRGAKGVPKGKVPDSTKSDDKSWGLYEWLSDTLGGGSDEADTGPQFGKNARAKGTDASGNFKGDRRIVSKGKKTVNEGVKFNPLDASTW